MIDYATLPIVIYVDVDRHQALRTEPISGVRISVTPRFRNWSEPRLT
jgi:hypothetical protein